MPEGNLTPALRSSVPGPKSKERLEQLARLENPAIARRRSSREASLGTSADPVVWARSFGSNVWDVDGNRFVDLTAGFGVAAVGHAHPRIVEAARLQMRELPHAMGDAFPGEPKAEFLEALAHRVPAPLSVFTLAGSGSEAVSVALKTAALSTGRSRFLSFDAGYHGLGLGALQVTGYRSSFREPFQGILAGDEARLAWPEHGDGTAELQALDDTLKQGEPVAAVILEPVLGRGGAFVPPPGFLEGVLNRAHASGALVIFDEILTGFGRTGKWFGCEHADVVPDLMTLGKGLNSGYPLSVCAGSPRLMSCWGESAGEAIHTSTFLGNPVGCAMALTTLRVLVEEDLVRVGRETGFAFLDKLGNLARRFPHFFGEPRGRGLLLALPVIDEEGDSSGAAAWRVSRELLERGFIALPCGLRGDAVQFTPPLNIDERLLRACIDALIDIAREHHADEA